MVNAPDLSSITALVGNDGGDGISLREAITLVSGTFITDIGASETAGVLGDNNGRILDVIAPAGDEVKLTGLTITGGRTTTADGEDGGGIRTLGSITLANSRISGNSAAGLSADGGGIFTPYGEVTVTSSTVSGNSTTGYGSAGGGMVTTPRPSTWTSLIGSASR